MQLARIACRLPYARGETKKIIGRSAKNLRKIRLQIEIVVEPFSGVNYYKLRYFQYP